MFVPSSAHSRNRLNSTHGIYRHVIRVGMVVLCWQLAVPVEIRAENPAGNDASARAGATRVQRLVDDYLPKLGMSAHVEVVVVPRNELMMSVEPMEGDARFRMSVDQSFLQTEALANDVAMRLVPKDTLMRVYEKVYERLGTKGTLARFVGD